MRFLSGRHLLVSLSLGWCALNPLETHAQSSLPTWEQWLAGANLSNLSPSAALSRLRQAPAQYQDLGDYHYWLGVYLQAASQPLDAAANELELALIIDPNHAGAWFDYGYLQCRLGQQTNCQSILSEARRRFGLLPVAQRQTERQPVSWQGEVRAGLGRSTNYNQGSANRFIPIQLGQSTESLELAPAYRPLAASFKKLEFDLVYLNPWQPQLEARVSLQHRSPVSPQEALGNLDSYLLDLTWHGAAEHRFTLNLQSMCDSILGCVQVQGLRWHHINSNVTAPSVAWSWLAALEHRQPDAPLPAYQTVIVQARQTITFKAGSALVATLGTEQDLNQDQRPGRGQNRFFASAIYDQPNLRQTPASLRLSLRLSDIRDSDSYSPIFGNVIRHNTQVDAAITLMWPLNQHTYLQSELRHFRQHSNLALFDQNETQFNMVIAYRY